MDLTEDEVKEILDLIDNSTFDFLELQVGDLKLTVSKGAYRPDISAAVAAPAAPPPEAAAVAAPQSSDPTPPAPGDAAPPVAQIREGLVPVAAPMVGTFYAAPKPGAPPFVEKGSRVEPDTTVGLIEVMKVFTSVQAGVSGVIEEMLAADAGFVEYGQALFLVKPDESGPTGAGSS